jgi:ketosteroid isomerase-like protein
MDTRQVVGLYFEYVNSGRWDDWLSLFADDVVMDEQLGGHIQGIEALAKSIQGLRGSKHFQNHPGKLFVDGNTAAVLWHIETVGPKGEPIEADGVNYYEIRNGKIAYFRNFHDSRPFKPILDG